jgi:hypothetical protein
MPLKPNDAAKLDQIVGRIQVGQFDENDVDNLLMKLRPFGGDRVLFLEVAHFVAHPDARDRGIGLQSIIAFADSMRYFQEYVSDGRQLVLDVPFPTYVYRRMLSQTRLTDERQLKERHRMSRASLAKKIKANFVVDEANQTCALRPNKAGVEFIAALQFISSFIYSRPAFHIREFHEELKSVMRAEGVGFDQAAWDGQADRISLAILCLVSNSEFELPGGDRAGCMIATEHDFRLLSGTRVLPTGVTSGEPTSFGSLMIRGEVTIVTAAKPPAHMLFPLLATDLDPHQHCDPNLFSRELAPKEFGSCVVEVLALARDMSLSADFKLYRTDSLTN